MIKTLNELVDNLKIKNYNIINVRVNIPINIAKLRNLKRAVETNRYIYDDIISKEVDNNIKTNYNNLTSSYLFMM